jgi:hypothetical protein
VVEWTEISVDLLGAGELRAEAADHHDWELQTFCLVDCHYLHMPFREGLVRVLVLVDAAVVQRPQEAVEQVKV